MKKTFVYISASLLLFMAACNQQAKDEQSQASPLVDSGLSYFGDSINPDGAVPSDQLLALLAGKDSVQVKLSGTIEEVCQKKGCWMILSDGDAWARVMTEHRYFLPKDASGQALVYGTLVRRELGERKARHYAEESDNGALPAQAATQEWQIDAIGVRLGE